MTILIINLSEHTDKYVADELRKYPDLGYYSIIDNGGNIDIDNLHQLLIKATTDSALNSILVVSGSIFSNLRYNSHPVINSICNRLNMISKIIIISYIEGIKSKIYSALGDIAGNMALQGGAQQYSNSNINTSTMLGKSLFSIACVRLMQSMESDELSSFVKFSNMVLNEMNKCKEDLT